MSLAYCHIPAKRSVTNSIPGFIRFGRRRPLTSSLVLRPWQHATTHTVSVVPINTAHVSFRSIHATSSKLSRTYLWPTEIVERPSWSEEWKTLGLGAQLVNEPSFPQKLFFVQLGFGVDQHGEDGDGTKAAIRAVRNAIEFNSIPGVIEHLPGGRSEMLIHVRLGIPAAPEDENKQVSCTIDHMQVAKVFPYGKLLPIQVEMGGLAFPTGRIVHELGDTNDIGICVAACISIGYNDDNQRDPSHTTYSTKDGY